MPWYVPWSDTLKKKVCRYLLQRYLGQFLEEKLSLEQLTVDFYKGTGTVTDVTLYAQALNDLCESQAWCVEVIGGRIGSIKVNIPWNALMSEDSSMEVTDLFMCIKPMPRQQDGTSMLESMWSSMSSSMQLAQDCLEKEGVGLSMAKKMEGLESFAQTIDNVLNRVKARLINTEIRLEYLTGDSDRGIALIIKVENIEYKNEAGGDPPDRPKNDNDSDDNQKEYSISTYTTHHITMKGITFYTEEFRIENNEKSMAENPVCSTISSEQFYSTISQFPEDDQRIDRSQSDVLYSMDAQTMADDSHINSTQIYRSESIMFGEIAGVQEILIKMKQTENVPGPKVQLQLNLGALNFFLSPRQFHLLGCLIDFFLNDTIIPPPSPSAVDNSTSASGTLDDNRSYITNSDDELKRQIDRLTQITGGGSVISGHGWSSDPNEPANSQGSTRHISSKRYVESVYSTISSLSSSMCSSISQSSQNTNRARKRGIIDSDPNADISSFNIRVASCAIILLHEDILVESADSAIGRLPLNVESIKKLKSMSDGYFDSVRPLTVNMGVNEIFQTGEILDKYCENHHLRLLLAPIIVEGEEQRNSSGNLLRFSISIARGDLREVLKDQSVPLIEFSKKHKVNVLPTSSEITIGIKQTTQSLRGTNGKKLGTPKLEITITLAPCLCEIDITILDRLNSLLNGQPFLSQLHQSTDVTNSKININITLQSINVRFRFPVTDLRPLYDPDRVPWWKRNVQPDYFLAHLIQTRIVCNLPSKYEIEANEINLFYCEDANSAKISLAKAVLVERSMTPFMQPEIDLPKVTIEIPSVEELHEPVNQGRSSDDSDGGQPMDYIGISRKEYSPFGSKRICRESDTPHSRYGAGGGVDGVSDTTGESENIKVPGDKEEMERFCDDAAKYARVKISLNLPLVSLQLKSKHLYEILYNRISTDLLLWQPSAPRMSASVSANSKIASNLLNIGMTESIYPPFTMCKSGINYDSTSTTNSESEAESEIIYYSVYDKTKPQKSLPADNTSAISFKMDVKNGMMTIYAPVRDSQNHVIPGQLGEFVIKINSAVMFSVNGYRGNDDLGYVCLQANSVELYHFGLIPVPSSNPPLRFIGCVLPNHLQSTIYPTPKNISLHEPKGELKREMVSIAVQIKSVPEQRIKRIKVAIGIQKSTLRHNAALPEHAWLTQLIDMFDVLDYPIQGYTPLGVVTEMHLHLWDCAIDYRPRYLPYRAIVTIGSFMMSSNISTACSGCTLRFVAEDSTMSIAPYTPPNDSNNKNKSENKITFLPAHELVCVVDVDLLEISLRLNEKASTTFPKLDLRASINGAHLRTCSDSATALAQLITYLATDGDLIKPNETQNVDPKTDAPTAANQDLGMELLSVKTTAPVVPFVSESQQKRVNSLMEEAMKESIHIVASQQIEDKNADDQENIFFFPDEANCKTTADKQSLSGGSSPTLVYSKSLSDSISSSNTDKQDLDSQQTTDTVSVNTELQDLLDFETSVMGIKSPPEPIETIPQVASELGNIVQIMKKTEERRISTDTDDEFCIISHEEKPAHDFGESDTSVEPLRIVDNHFSVPIGKTDLLKAPKGFPMAVMRYTLCEMTLTWHIYGGNDFPLNVTDPIKIISPKDSTTMQNAPNVSPSSTSSTSGSTSARLSTKQTKPTLSIRTPMSNAYQMGVSYSKGSPNNVVFNTGSTTGSSCRKKTWRERGGLERKHDILMEVQVSKVRFSHEAYPTDSVQVSRQVLLIGEIEIRDRLAVSNIKKFLYLPSSERRKCQNMVVVKILHLRPDSKLRAQECCLRISLLPLRLNIDQDSLLFLVGFFNNIGNLNDDSSSNNSNANKSLSTPPSHHAAPIMMVDLPEAEQEIQARKMVEENLMLLMEDDEKQSKNPSIGPEIEENVPIFFSNVVFSPSVLISLDYHGKKIELSHGPLAGLLMGLGQLQCSQITLKSLAHRNGILGIDRLINFFFREWLQDIKSHQLSSVLKGVGTMNTFIQLFQGIKDLFILPIEQYQKDGRIVRGLQMGAQSFTARTALALLEITTKVIYLLQITAETAYDMVSPGPSVRRIRLNRKGKRKRLNPPQDIREGVTNAFHIVKEGVGDTAHTIVEMTALEHDQKGYTGAVGAVIRQIPPTVVKPIVLATQATTNVLGGVKNQLLPDARQESKEKWKDDDD